MMGDKAIHPTHLMTTRHDYIIVVKEPRTTILSRIKDALHEGHGWFEATSDAEGEYLFINARMVVAVAREHTPIEQMKAEGVLP